MWKALWTRANVVLLTIALIMVIFAAGMNGIEAGCRSGPGRVVCMSVAAAVSIAIGSTPVTGGAAAGNILIDKSPGVISEDTKITTNGTGVLTDTQSIGATSTDGYVLANTTAAAAGAQQWSPRFHLVAQGWKTNATAGSQTLDQICELQPAQGTANPTNSFVCSMQTAAGGYVQTWSVNYNPGNAALDTFVIGSAGVVLNLLPGNDGSGTLGLAGQRWGNMFGFGNIQLSGAASNVATATVMVGSITPLTMAAGEVGLAKIAASGSAPGAAGLKYEAVCGTNAGSAKLIAYAGTSTTPVTITDNIGSGVTGC